MPRNLTLAAIQLDANPAPTADRLARAQTQLEQAAAQDAHLAVLPELFNTGYIYDDSNYTRAERMDGPTVTWMRETAARLNLHLAGSLMLLDVDEVYNALLLFAPNGRMWRYNKVYPWGWERGYFRNGRDVTVAETDLGRIGMLVCWDTAHLDLWRRYAGQVDFMLVSSCPPDVSNPTYRFPDGETATFADMGPLVQGMQDAGKRLFGEMVNEQTAWLGVPMVATVGAGRVTTRLPQAKASLAAMVPLAPWLAKYVPVAEDVEMSCDIVPGCKVVDANGKVLASVSEGSGDAFTLGEVVVRDQRPVPNRDQPASSLPPMVYVTSDYLLPWLTIPTYRQGLRRAWGAQMAPLEASTRQWVVVALGAGLLGYLMGRRKRRK